MTRITLPSPHPGQQAVIEQAQRFNWLSAGRRWRKTTLAMAIAVDNAVHGKTIIWGAPVYDQVRVCWAEAKKAAGGVANFHITRKEVEFPGGGTIFFRSLDDPDNVRGRTADGVVIDEIGYVKAEAWYEVLRPMLIDTGGWAWGIGTPQGRNWFHTEFHKAADSDNAVAWQSPTLGVEIVDGELIRKPHPLENPEIPFSEILHLFETMPERTFRQEILAEFLEGEGAVFRNIKANLWKGGDPPSAHADHRLVMGVDWGKQADFTALSVVCADCRKELAIDRFNQIDYAFQRQRLQALAEKWGVSYINAESNAMGEPVIEQLQRDGLPVYGFQTTATSKPPLIESLALALEREEAQWLADPVATAELEAYERSVSERTGRSSYSAPEGMHDDTVMARALANQAINDYTWYIY